MKGNKAFIESQRETDAASNAKAEQIMRDHPVARVWFDTVASRR